MRGQEVRLFRWQFRVGCILMGWDAVEASLALRTSIGTVINLQEGDLDEKLVHHVAERAMMVFRESGIIFD